ncbi:MAG: carbamoyl-phosphate synthase large subunit [Acidobacteria bacterium]|nr:MAG: carbamoyl-phosphate synthase large subunit [Acidobacteriota bacterium]
MNDTLRSPDDTPSDAGSPAADRRIRSLLIANRGEIALRIARSARERGIRVVALRAPDDPWGVPTADAVVELRGTGPGAFLDPGEIVAAATAQRCDALHPGYGFLSERAELAELCAEQGVRFLGPSPRVLRVFADKLAARRQARDLGVPVLAATGDGCTLQEASAFADRSDGPVVIKAVHGGGGRGMRLVSDEDRRDPERFAALWRRCASEAAGAFGDDALYVERSIERARHIEIQIVGDGERVVALGERDCTLQRRHQKIVEIAPSPDLSPALRERLTDDAVRPAASVGYAGLGTFEFLVDCASRDPDSGASRGYAFIEANPRLQVEHTITEEVCGLDLVQLQLAIGEGRSLDEVGLQSPPRIHGFAIQSRICAETFDADGRLQPGGGTVRRLTTPLGPGVRLDTHLAAGAEVSPSFDPLVAKLVVHARGADGDFTAALRKWGAALAETEVDGVVTNLGFLRHLADLLGGDPERFARQATTTWIDRELAAQWGSRQGAIEANRPQPEAEESAEAVCTQDAARRRRAGATLGSDDPLAVLELGRSGAERTAAEDLTEHAPGVVAAPMQGTVIGFEVAVGEDVVEGQPVAILEAMKMEHEITAPCPGIVREQLVEPGAPVWAGTPLLRIEPSDSVDASVAARAADLELGEADLERVRDDLQELIDRKGKLLDENRPEAVARRRKTGQRTARENVEDLVDPGSWIEYGGLAVAAQRRRRELQDLIDRTPADGLIAGIGTVNADTFPAEAARCAVLSYDYTVLAGTQGKQNHEKKDRLFDLARDWRLPVVFFTEGGGGRPGDTDVMGVAGLDCWAFRRFGELSGLVPLVGINSGRCFAGNAALLGCCDVVIATANSNIGMGGPAMIEGGGLGVFRPEEVGPMSVQVPNGVVDVAVRDEAEAVAVAKRYLGYFQGPLERFEGGDPRTLRHLVPENRLRVYDVRRVVEQIADRGSVLELRPRFGVGMVTALARVGGRPLGIVANNPQHLAGAIDSPGADKAARFLQLCDAFDLPVLMLCDTPGIMVGPETEKTAIVRHCSRLFVIGASMTVPVMTVVLRKGYGLGAQAMAAGSFKAPLFTVAWPTGEFGGMGLEGAVKLGYRKELAAIDDPAERKATFERMVAESYERGKAINTASHLEVDDVIDPADTRHWISRGLASVPAPPRREGKKRPCVDTW